MLYSFDTGEKLSGTDTFQPADHFDTPPSPAPGDTPPDYDPWTDGPPYPAPPGKVWHWNGSGYELVDAADPPQTPGTNTQPGGTPGPAGPPNPWGSGYNDPNNGSPPAVPLQPGMQWNWNGTVWSQVPASAAPAGGGGSGGSGGTGGSGGGGGGGARPPSGPAGMDGRARAMIDQLIADGHNVTSNGINGLMIDGRAYTLPEAPDQPTWAPTMFTPGQLPYQPTAIPTADLDQYGYDKVAARLSGTQAYQANDALVRDILAHPESMDQRTIDMLKAKSADELAAIGTAEDADILRYGWNTGNQDSNWIGSERAASQQRRDVGLVGKNRDIEIAAKQQNFQDRLSAANLGTQWTGEQRQREALANDVGLKAAALRGDRLQFNEQMKAKAAELGIAADELLQNWVIAKMEDLTRRYGIEVQGSLDLARLSVQSSQFQQDLAFRLAQLEQQAELAYAGYGLDALRIDLDSRR